MKKSALFIFLLFSIHLSAQKIYGVVFNDTGDLLPYSSITIKKTTIGAVANNKAKFIVNVTPGIYTVVCQHIGYASQEKQITIGKEDEEVSFVLKAQQLRMKEVIIKKGEDPAYAIIRQAIKKRPFYNIEVRSFTCDFYSKNILKLYKLPAKIFGKKINENGKEDMNGDTIGRGIVYLSESLSRIAMQQPDKFKLDVQSSRVSGSSSFGF
ncbi:MAG TPA: DUF5686 family protein, partial [Bacteroidia bacterium]|nr:DUF5686 family protein [Bacteroidia bacterium]